MRNIITAGAPSRESKTYRPMACGRNSPLVGSHENAGECPEVVSVSRQAPPRHGSPAMHINLSLAPLAALLAGIFILIMPRLLNYIVAVYLILTGLLGLFGGGGSLHLR